MLVTVDDSEIIAEIKSLFKNRELYAAGQLCNRVIRNTLNDKIRRDAMYQYGCYWYAQGMYAASAFWLMQSGYDVESLLMKISKKLGVTIA